MLCYSIKDVSQNSLGVTIFVPLYSFIVKSLVFPVIKKFALLVSASSKNLLSSISLMMLRIIVGKYLMALL
jgi:hypothetical protein